MKIQRLAALGLLLGALGAAPKDAPLVVRVPTPDQLVSKIHAVDQMEMDAGRLAQKKGSTEGVRRYGLVLQRDHALADRRVMGLARAQGLRVAAVPPTAEEEAAMTRLHHLTGPAFDEAFLQTMIAGHERVLGLLREARQDTPDVRLGALIARLIPILEQHDQLAGGLSDTLHGG
jgi:putative membrane protein